MGVRWTIKHVVYIHTYIQMNRRVYETNIPAAAPQARTGDAGARWTRRPLSTRYPFPWRSLVQIRPHYSHATYGSFLGIKKEATHYEHDTPPAGVSMRQYYIGMRARVCVCVCTWCACKFVTGRSSDGNVY